MDSIWQFISSFFVDLYDNLYLNLVQDSRYLYILEGLGNTLIITFFSLLLGIFVGIIIAVIKVSVIQVPWLRIPEIICNFYLTIIRGTPIVLQLMIMFFVVFSSSKNAVPIAILTFGMNSGAYVAEIIRSGILAVDYGQREAGMSLGLTYSQTMIKIIMPQAIKNILPALGNEFITLLKETSVAGYVAVQDLTKGANTISSRTYDYFIPLITVGLIYLVLVIGLTELLKIFERRLRESDKR